jgi:hypothetical protein
MSRPTITGAAFSQRLLSCASGPFTGPILKVAFGSDLTRSLSPRGMAAPCALPSPMVSAANVRFPANAAQVCRLGLTLMLRRWRALNYSASTIACRWNATKLA